MKGILLVAGFLFFTISNVLAEDWAPSEVQKNGAAETAFVYFRMLDTGRFDAAFKLFAPEIKNKPTLAEYVKHWQEIKRRIGQLTTRRLGQTSWSPEGTKASPKLAVAIEYDGAYARADVYCGHLLMVEVSEGFFMILRDDVTLMTTDHVRRMPPQVRIQMFNRPGCRRYLSADE